MMNWKMDEKFENICKKIGLIFLCFVVFVTTIVTCELIYNTASYLNRGFDLETAMQWAADDVDYELEQVSDYLENLFPKRERKSKITEYPVVNWNINWNTLNKP